jgi:signal transduction histidine kinase
LLSEVSPDRSQVPDERSYEQHLELFRSVASDVAHDLNNLLLLISGYTELLSKNLDDREQVVQIVRNIQTATLGVRQLTEKLQSIGQATDEVTANFPSTPKEDFPSPNREDHREVRIVVAVQRAELREFVSQVLKRSGFDVLEIGGDDFNSDVVRNAGRFANVLILDVENAQSSDHGASQAHPTSIPEVPTLFLVDENGEVPILVAPSIFTSLTKPFVPSQLISAVDGLYVQSKSPE